MKKLIISLSVFLTVFTFGFSAEAVTTIIDIPGDGPTALAIDSNDNVYTANVGDGESPSTMSLITSAGDASEYIELLHDPDYIVLDSNDIPYTLSTDAGNISKIFDGGRGLSVSDFAEDLVSPEDMIIDSNDNIYTITSDNIRKINTDGSSVLYGIKVLGSPDRGYGIVALAVDSNDNIYTADEDTNTITKVSSDVESSIFASLDESPIDLVANSENEIFVLFGQRVARYSSTGELISDEFYSVGSGNLDTIAIDSEDSIYVSYNSPFGFPVIIKVFESGDVIGSIGSYYGGDIVIDSNLNVYTERLNTDQVLKASQISLIEQTQIGTTENTTPSYSFSSNKAGDITYGGSCSSEDTTAVAGLNTITLSSLEPGIYDDCTIVVDDGTDTSNTLAITEFTINEEETTRSSVRLSASEVIRRFALARTRPTKDKKEIKDKDGETEQSFLERTRPTKDKKDVKDKENSLSAREMFFARTRPTKDKKEIKDKENSLSARESCSEDRQITSNLRQGDRNEQVRLLQEHINRILADYYETPAGPADGIFGPQTKLGVQRLQEALAQEQGADLGNAGADGIVGPFTRDAVNQSC